MIKYQLKCSRDHAFEAWFRNSDSFDAQAEAGALACPVCGDRNVVKAPMAPRIARSAIGTAAEERRQAMAATVAKKLTEIRSHIEQNCDYVGDRFAEEARRIHYGETPKRDIYGEATERESEELTDEGIDFGRIPWPSRTDS